MKFPLRIGFRLAVAVAVVLGGLALPAGLSAAIFMQVDGVSGDSNAAGYSGWIEVDKLEGGLQRIIDLVDSNLFAVGFQDVAIEKRMDKSSVKLAEFVATGRVVPMVELVVTNPQFAGTPAPMFVRLSLRNALVTRYQVLATAEGVPVEKISFNFEELTVLVVPGMGAEEGASEWVHTDVLTGDTSSGSTQPGGDDRDGDGIPDAEDNCPETFNPTQADKDNDGRGDVCDPDIDGDKILNGEDNCPFVSNSSQENNDRDLEGDACDPDDDNDGMPDEYELKTARQDPPLDPLVADGHLDFDRDGITNVDECRAGTNPYDPTSGFWARFAPFDGSTADLSFPTVPGQTYHVYFTKSLSEDFKLLFTHTARTSGETSLVVPSTAKIGFFAVVVE